MKPPIRVQASRSRFPTLRMSAPGTSPLRPTEAIAVSTSSKAAIHSKARTQAWRAS